MMNIYWRVTINIPINIVLRERNEHGLLRARLSRCSPVGVHARLAARPPESSPVEERARRSALMLRYAPVKVFAHPSVHPPERGRARRGGRLLKGLHVGVLVRQRARLSKYWNVILIMQGRAYFGGFWKAWSVSEAGRHDLIRCQAEEWHALGRVLSRLSYMFGGRASRGRVHKEY